jgi:hypothetical protein
MPTDLLSPPVAEKKSERFEMKIEPTLLARLRRQAERFSVADAAYVRLAIIEKLERDEATDTRKKK